MSKSLLKNLIVVLLGLNAFYLIWTLTIGKYNDTPPLLVEEGVPELTLLPIQNSDIYQSDSSTHQSSCYTFGPFNSEKTSRIIAKNINNFGLATKIQKQKTMQTLNFLVYLEPFATRAEAVKVTNDISKQEVTEYKIIETGPYKNAIALGSFRSLDEARRHSEYIRFLGYDAKYTTQKKQKEVYWVEYDEPFGSNAPVIKWATEIDPRNSAQKIPKACAF